MRLVKRVSSPATFVSRLPSSPPYPRGHRVSTRVLPALGDNIEERRDFSVDVVVLGGHAVRRGAMTDHGRRVDRHEPRVPDVARSLRGFLLGVQKVFLRRHDERLRLDVRGGAGLVWARFLLSRRSSWAMRRLPNPGMEDLSDVA